MKINPATHSTAIDWLAAELWFDNYSTSEDRQTEWKEVLATAARRTDPDKKNLINTIEWYRQKALRLFTGILENL